MCENTVDTQQDLLRYKQMYLRMVRAVMDAENCSTTQWRNARNFYFTKCSNPNFSQTR